MQLPAAHHRYLQFFTPSGQKHLCTNAEKKNLALFLFAETARHADHLVGKTKTTLARRYRSSTVMQNTDNRAVEIKSLLIYPGAVELSGSDMSRVCSGHYLSPFVASNTTGNAQSVALIKQVLDILREEPFNKSGDRTRPSRKDVLICVHGNQVRCTGREARVRWTNRIIIYMVFCVCFQDRRCGEFGPDIIGLMDRALNGDSRVRLWECSHIGGHAYAGNVVIYPEGDWYGNVRTEVCAHQRFRLTCVY
jgi:hypothetical protein